MSGWTDEAAWLVMPDGTPKLHPQTQAAVRSTGEVVLTAHKVKNYSVTLRPNHVLAKAAVKLLH